MQTLVSAQPGSYAVIERRPLTPGRGVFLLPCFFPAHMGGWGSSVAIVTILNRQKREGGGVGEMVKSEMQTTAEAALSAFPKCFPIFFCFSNVYTGWSSWWSSWCIRIRKK